MRRIVMVALVVGMLGSGCTLGLRLDHAPAGTALDAQLQGPGHTVVLKDASGETLGGVQATVNPVAILRNLLEWVASLTTAAPAE